MTTSDTHFIRYPLPWGLCRNLSTRHLVGNCMVTTWENTRYQLQPLCRNQGGTDTRFCSLPLVPLVGERIVTTVTTSSLSGHSTVTTWGALLCSRAMIGWLYLRRPNPGTQILEHKSLFNCSLYDFRLAVNLNIHFSGCSIKTRM